MDSIVVPGVSYFLGEQTAVSIILPTPSTPAIEGDLKMGEIISVVFYSGTNAATLTITGDTISEIIAPSTNQRVEINILWDCICWAIVSNTMKVSND